jgi:four helix bundle protein
MNHKELYSRLYAFSLAVDKFAAPYFDRELTADVADQLTRGARGAAANYRAAGHGRSHAEFTAKIGVALEEADEAEHWLRFLADAGYASGAPLAALVAEAGELTAILGASFRTANRNARPATRRRPRRRPARRPRGTGDSR